MSFYLFIFIFIFCFINSFFCFIIFGAFFFFFFLIRKRKWKGRRSETVKRVASFLFCTLYLAFFFPLPFRCAWFEITWNIKVEGRKCDFLFMVRPGREFSFFFSFSLVFNGSHTCARFFFSFSFSFYLSLFYFFNLVSRPFFFLLLLLPRPVFH